MLYEVCALPLFETSIIIQLYIYTIKIIILWTNLNNNNKFNDQLYNIIGYN